MKRAEYPLAPLGDSVDAEIVSDEAEEMLATLSPELRQIAYRIRLKAVDAAEAAQSAIQRALETGELLMQLQEGMGCAHGGPRGNQYAKVPRGTLPPFTFEDLAYELGVPRRTAFRWMSLAKANQLALRIEAGEEVELPPSKDWGEQRIVGGTIEHREIAAQWRAGLIAGETPISRAQPALMGALTTKKVGRAPIHHERNLAVAIGKLHTSLGALTDLDPDAYASLEKLWFEDVVPWLPERWLKRNEGAL